MEELTKQQEEDVSKMIVITLMAFGQELGVGFNLETIAKMKYSIIKDFEQGSLKKSVIQYNEFFE